MDKKKLNLWPYSIVASILFIIFACAMTIKIAVDNPVQMDSAFLDKYKQVDENINDILEKQKKFNALYSVEVFKDSISRGENSIKLKVVDKQNNPIDNAEVEILITRPDSVKFDIKLTPISNSNGIYNFESFQIEKLGRWQILSKVSIGDLTTFTKQEVYATN